MEVTSLGFKKPADGEFYDIQTVNHNTQLANDLIEDNTSAIGQNTHDIAQLSNPNLLINETFQIWQSGTSFTSFVNSILTYTADRWYSAQGIGTTISVSKDSDNSLKFSQTGVGGSHVAQFIEGDYSNLVGKKVTMSICSKGNVDTVMQILDYNTGLGGKIVPASAEYKITSLTVQLPNSITKDKLRCLLNFANNQGTINIKWIKLELGEIATPLSPRPIGEELTLCQRYGITAPLYAIMTQTDSNTIYFDLVLPVNFRSQAITFNNCVFQMNNKNGDAISTAGFTFTAVVLRGNRLLIQAYKSNHGVTSSNIALVIASGFLDNEIY